MKSIITLFTIFCYVSLFGQETDKASITGDKDLDNCISVINTNATNNYESYKKEMSVQFGISASIIDQYVKQEKVSPGDLYYGCSLSKETNKSISDVMSSYKKNKGWGKAAKDLGIKPGSEQFHNFKANTLKGENNFIKSNDDKGNKNDNKNQKQNQIKQENNSGKAPDDNNQGKK